MAIEVGISKRIVEQCDLCGQTEGLQLYPLPASEGIANSEIGLCSHCEEQISQPIKLDATHFRCLSNSMWSTEPAVQVMVWRLLKHFSHESWASDLLDMLYLDDAALAWAQAGLGALTPSAITRDSNGVELQAGDSVTIIKDLDVKGTSFVAKRGTAVRNISLTNNPEHIEGRVNGTKIVILTCYVKKG